MPVLAGPSVSPGDAWICVRASAVQCRARVGPVRGRLLAHEVEWLTWVLSCVLSCAALRSRPDGESLVHVFANQQACASVEESAVTFEVAFRNCDDVGHTRHDISCPEISHADEGHTSPRCLNGAQQWKEREFQQHFVLRGLQAQCLGFN